MSYILDCNKITYISHRGTVFSETTRVPNKDNDRVPLKAQLSQRMALSWLLLSEPAVTSGVPTQGSTPSLDLH